MALSAQIDKNGLFKFGVIVLLEFLLLCPSDGSGPQAVVPHKALSSPSSITTMENSTVWLHWNYTFNNFGGAITFVKQQWSVNDTALKKATVIAEKIGLNGQMTVASSLPSSFVGRVIAFPSNGTLMIKNLQYNDTFQKFDSAVIVKLSGTTGNSPPFQLEPMVSVNVKGAPEYLFSPSSNLEFTENNLLSVVAQFDGNPKPVAEVQWSDSVSKTAMSVTQEYPFVYRAEYSINQIASSYCGKTLTITVQNNVGKAADIAIAVTVLLNLNDPYLRAGKPNQSCVEVQWQKKESGLCSVTYTVKFKDQTDAVQYQQTEINKAGATKCGIPSNVNITKVELTMSSTKRSQTFTATVSENPIPPPTSASTTKETSTQTSSKPTKSTSNANASTKTNAPTATVKTPAATLKPPKASSQVGAIVGGAVGGLVALVLLVLLVVYCMKRGTRGQGRDNDSGEPGYPLANKKENVYASADEPNRKGAPEPTYADPNKPTLIYGKLGEGGGRKGPRPPRSEPSEYADVMLDEQGYPAVGAVTSYTDGYGNKAPRSRENSGRRGGSENRRQPPPYTEPKLDEDGYPSSGRIPPVYAQVDKSRRKR